MTLKEILEQRKLTLAAVLAERKSVNDKITALRGELPESGDVPSELAQRIESALAERKSIEARVDAASAALAETETEIEREESIEALQCKLSSTGAPSTRGPAAGDGVQREQRTYGPHNRSEGVSFLRDVVGMVSGDLGAMERIQRHRQEELTDRSDMIQRDVGTSAFAGVTIPQYLIDLVAPKAAAGRPLADNARKLELPGSGMTVEISRITTATGTAVQATENANVQETDIDDTQLTVNVRTIAGQQDVSRQAIDRSVGTEGIIVGDLFKQYHTTLDSQIINGAGTLGTHLGIRSTVGIKAVTYTDATPTPSEAWGPLWDLQQQIESAVFNPISHFVMHPRRWAFFTSAIGTNQTMLQNLGVPVTAIGVEQSKQYGAGVRGLLAGIPVIVDANIPTTISSTQDVILGVTADELFLWEQPGSPLLIRAEQTGAGSLSVKLVVYGYSAFTAGRYPDAHGTISGTGLTTPTFGIAAS